MTGRSSKRARPSAVPRLRGVHDGLLAEVHDGASREGKRGSRLRRSDPDVRVHLGLQQSIGVVEHAADVRRARRGVERARDPVDRPFERLVCVCERLDGNLRADGHPPQILLVDVTEDPDSVELPYSEKLHGAFPLSYCPCTSMPGFSWRAMTSPSIGVVSV